MSWAGLANNQTISFTNLKDAVDTGVFLSKTTQVTSNEQITKADADTYAWVNTLYTPFANKANNQLVVKSDLIKACWCWIIQNDDETTVDSHHIPCGTDSSVTIPIGGGGDFIRVCANAIPTIDTFIASITICGSGGNATRCYLDADCTGCSDCGSPCGDEPFGY